MVGWANAGRTSLPMKRKLYEIPNKQTDLVPQVVRHAHKGPAKLLNCLCFFYSVTGWPLSHRKSLRSCRKIQYGEKSAGQVRYAQSSQHGPGQAAIQLQIRQRSRILSPSLTLKLWQWIIDRMQFCGLAGRGHSWLFCNWIELGGHGTNS